ncbi:ATP-binding cassette, sub-B (MDR TAP), member 4, partial [Mortierella antarctica]
MADTPTPTTNDSLKEEIVGQKIEISSSPDTELIHIVNIDQDSTASPDLSEKNSHDAPEVNKNKRFKWGKKNKDTKAKEVQEPVAKVTYLQLYRFASTWDWICVSLGTICSIVNGIGQPLVALLMGDVITSLAKNFDDPIAAAREVRVSVIKFTVVGAIAFVASYGQMCFWTLSAENQSKRIREKYLHAVLRQDISWHDVGKKSESLNSRLSADTQLIFDGLADKIGLTVMCFVTFIAGFVIAFSNGWRMSLVLMSTVPLMAVCGAFMAKYATQSSVEGQGSYAKAGGLAEQAIGSIRTVFAFNGQKRELQKFSVNLDAAYKEGVKKAWATAQAAAFAIFETIDRVPDIDSASPDGAKPANLTGHIVVRDVNFAYPSRPDVPVLKNMNIEVKPGQTVALVGHSG